MPSFKKLTCKGTLRQVFICLRLRTPYPPPLHIVCMYTVNLFTQGRGRGGGKESWTREKVRGATVHKEGVEHTNMTDWLYLQSINSDKHLSKSPFTGKFLFLNFMPVSLLWKRRNFARILFFYHWRVMQRSLSNCKNFQNLFYKALLRWTGPFLSSYF